MAEQFESARSSEVSGRLQIGRSKKDEADKAFKAGDIKTAIFRYHEALLYLNGLDKSALPGYKAPEPGDQEKEKSEIDDLLEKVHSNMSACHIKNSNWKRALESAEKAIAKNEKNYKAIFRKGKALGELGFFEKADKTLTQLKKDNPADGPIIDAELKRLRAMDQERERVHSQKYRGFLSKDKGDSKPTKVDKGKGVDPAERTVPLSSGARQTAHIEEVEIEPEQPPNAPESDEEIPVVKG